MDTEKSLWSIKNLCPTNRYSAFISFSHWPIVSDIFLRLFFWLDPIDIPRRDSSVLCTSNLIFSFSYFFFFSFFPAASIASSERIRQVWLDWHPFSSFTYFLSLFFVFCFLSASALIAVAFPILDYTALLYSCLYSSSSTSSLFFYATLCRFVFPVACLYTHVNQQK